MDGVNMDELMDIISSSLDSSVMGEILNINSAEGDIVKILVEQEVVMKIKINSKEANLSISVPLSLASTCVRLIPSKEISKEDKK